MDNKKNENNANNKNNANNNVNNKKVEFANELDMDMDNKKTNKDSKDNK